jgi:hypothetical protein
MARTKLPRLIEIDGVHAVEIAPGVHIMWWREGDVWSVSIEGPVEAGLDVRNVKVEPAVHCGGAPMPTP